jgi:hypothetical protein
LKQQQFQFLFCICKDTKNTLISSVEGRAGAAAAISETVLLETEVSRHK